MSRFAARAFVGLFLICLILSTLAGCVRNTSEQGSDSGAAYDNPAVFRDRMTGCEYLTTVNANSLTPRIAADGKTHMGCAGLKP